MKLQKIIIDHYRSIEHVELLFPKNEPLILLGPNNSGKSNILKAIECIIGEKYAGYLDFEDSDYYKRSKPEFPNISFKAYFDKKIKTSYPYSNSLCFSTNHEFIHYKTRETLVENTYHYEDGQQMFIKNEEREQCQFILIDATRDISRQFSYFSQYSLLSKMAKKMHGVLIKNTREKLDQHFQEIKDTFELVPEYKNFLEKLKQSFNNNTEGFEHRLDIDLSAYDPNNYFNSLRIIAREGGDSRAFTEFGTGEQQILLISFVKAYAETFKNDGFILGIEEPEAHLHPLAQRWLAKNIQAICQSGVQVVITTHSPEFLDIKNLAGFVKVYKENGTTKTVQHTAETLVKKCIELGSNSTKTTPGSILEYYKINTFHDQLRGFFARKIILVEGPSELFSLPNYFLNYSYDLIKDGIEIIDCRGKNQIARNYRLFKAFGYDCFCLFDGDGSRKEHKQANDDLGNTFGFDSNKMVENEELFTYQEDTCYGYFGKDYETYLRSNLEDYKLKETEISSISKVLKAKIISEQNEQYTPSFIENIAKYFKMKKNESFTTNIKEEAVVAEKEAFIPPDDIPF